MESSVMTNLLIRASLQMWFITRSIHSTMITLTACQSWIQNSRASIKFLSRQSKNIQTGISWVSALCWRMAPLGLTSGRLTNKFTISMLKSLAVPLASTYSVRLRASMRMAKLGHSAAYGVRIAGSGTQLSLVLWHSNQL